MGLAPQGESCERGNVSPPWEEGRSAGTEGEPQRTQPSVCGRQSRETCSDGGTPGPPQRVVRIPAAGRRGRVLRLGIQSQALREDCGYSLRGLGCDLSQPREDRKKCGPAGEARRWGVWGQGWNFIGTAFSTCMCSQAAGHCLRELGGGEVCAASDTLDSRSRCWSLLLTRVPRLGANCYPHLPGSRRGPSICTPPSKRIITSTCWGKRGKYLNQIQSTFQKDIKLTQDTQVCTCI